MKIDLTEWKLLSGIEEGRASSDNRRLAELYRHDQKDREPEVIDWGEVGPRDKARQAEVVRMLRGKKLQTSMDYTHAAMIMHHAWGQERLAQKLAKKAVRLDPKNQLAAWLVKAAYDRELLRKGKPQKYGTQGPATMLP